MKHSNRDCFSSQISSRELIWPEISLSFQQSYFYKGEGECLPAEPAKETLALQHRERWLQQSQDCPLTPALEYGSVCPWQAAEQEVGW